jgi:hypothetical protein
MSEKITVLDNASNFFSGPAEFLCEKIAEQLKLVPQFVNIFGVNIDAYQRMDYSIRELPAIRIYNHSFIKEFESWFINGDILIDIIFPANLRRTLQQKYQDTIVSALCQQFRREEFFGALCISCPALNELGKEFSADKSLGFKWGEGQQEAVPLTQIKANFRLDLRAWDDFLISDDRTKNDPFEKTLGDLDTIRTIIEGQNDNDTLNVSVEVFQTM